MLGLGTSVFGGWVLKLGRKWSYLFCCGSVIERFCMGLCGMALTLWSLVTSRLLS